MSNSIWRRPPRTRVTVAFRKAVSQSLSTTMRMRLRVMAFSRYNRVVNVDLLKSCKFSEKGLLFLLREVLLFQLSVLVTEEFRPSVSSILLTA